MSWSAMSELYLPITKCITKCNSDHALSFIVCFIQHTFTMWNPNLVQLPSENEPWWCQMIPFSDPFFTVISRFPENEPVCQISLFTCWGKINVASWAHFVWGYKWSYFSPAAPRNSWRACVKQCSLVPEPIFRNCHCMLVLIGLTVTIAETMYSNI